jgi:hypothetical protein
VSTRVGASVGVPALAETSLAPGQRCRRRRSRRTCGCGRVWRGGRISECKSRHLELGAGQSATPQQLPVAPHCKGPLRTEAVRPGNVLLQSVVEAQVMVLVVLGIRLPSGKGARLSDRRVSWEWVSWLYGSRRASHVHGNPCGVAAIEAVPLYMRENHGLLKENAVYDAMSDGLARALCMAPWTMMLAAASDWLRDVIVLVF